jgi:gamma-glutamyltranspeptidase/glutathione hydrolase
MSPTIVLDASGKPVLTVGAAGGPRIITQVLLAVLRTIDLKLSLPEALAAPRFHHQWRPNLVSYERDLDSNVVEGLRSLGHNVEDDGTIARAQGVALESDGKFIGVADPRAGGKAAGL